MRQGIGMRFAYGLAWVFAIVAAVSLVLFIVALGRLGFEHTYTASALSSAVFFTLSALTMAAVVSSAGNKWITDYLDRYGF